MRKITLTTQPNGYTLDIDGTGYMYFDEEQLIDGLIYHVGFARKEVASRDMLKSLTTALKEWRKADKKIMDLAALRNENDQLRARCAALAEEIDRATIERPAASPEVHYKAIMVHLTMKETGLLPRVLAIARVVGCKLSEENTTVGDLVRHTREEVLNTPGCGAGMIKYIDKYLVENGLTYAMDVDAIIWLHNKRKK